MSRGGVERRDAVRALRTATTAAGVVVGVVAWITLVPLFDLLRSLARAVSGGAMPTTRAGNAAATGDQTPAAEPRVDRAA